MKKPTRALRVRRAAAALEAHLIMTGDRAQDEDEQLCDLLTNLLHWCDRYGVPFDRALTHAREHFQAEQTPTPR